MRTFKLIIFVCLLFQSYMASAERCGENSLSCDIGIFPHTGTQQIRDTFGAIAEDISLELDVTTRLKSTEHLDEFKSNLLKEAYDVALIGPGTYSSIFETIPYVPLVRPSQKVFFHIIVQQSSDINFIDDLEGKRFGRLTQNSGTWLTSYTMLANANVYNKIGRFVDYGSTHACVYGMAAGLVDACTVPSPFFGILKGQIPVDLKVIQTSVPLPSSVYVVHEDVSKENKALLREYFLQRQDFTIATKEDYQIIRNMLERLPE